MCITIIIILFYSQALLVYQQIIEEQGAVQMITVDKLIYHYVNYTYCNHSCNVYVPNAKITFKIVKPGLLSPVMLNTIQMFLPVVHVVLKGPVAVVAVVSLAHGASYIFQPGMRHTLYL